MKMNIYRSSKYTQIAFSAFSLSSVVVFAFWWFNPTHIPHNFSGILKIVDVFLFVLVSYVVWHPILMEVINWCISLHIKDIRQQKPIPGLRVAFITTIVPANEPLSLLHKCLPTMVKAKYKHDTWLLDEGNSHEVKKICQQYGVKHFSRLGKNEYNTRTGKFTKTKGGNHNSWYESYGNNYDIVAQIDTDFVPKPNFLTKTLGYFRDPKVAFVGTPQIYGNTKTSLIAQGASEQQYSFYGSVLRGLSGMGMTLLIGANHVVRVAAFKDVGHYTAHITEDLITGMKLHANGWKSVYLPYPLAIGEGPYTWESYFNQQLRWAYGCMDILFHHSPKHLKKMGVGQAMYYFFLLQHYFSGIAMALSILLLSFYFALGLRAADIDTVKFFTFYSLILLICWLMSVGLQRYNVYREKEGELLLVGKIISIAAWPIWFIAFINVLIGKRLSYKVTPKGENDTKVKTSPMVFFPHFVFGVIAVIGLMSSFFTHRQSTVMLFWALSSASLMLTVPFAQSIVRGWSKVRTRLFGFTRNTYHTFKLVEEKIKEYTFQAKSEKVHFVQSSSIGTQNLDTSEKKKTTRDCIFLCFVVFASLVLYIQKIGFYSDDWSFLGNFSLSHDQSLIGLYQTATTPNTQMRPLQNLYDALLYWLFGIHPFGYQLINAVVFLSIVLLFYFVLRQLRVPRIIAIAVPLVYALLPNYSTDRFWYAAFQVNLSILLFFFSLYAGLRAFSSHTTRIFLWKVVSIFSLLLSTLSYEVALPLVFLNVILFWNPMERFTGKTGKQYQNHTVFILLNFIALVYIVVFKALTTTRLGKFNYPGDVAHITISVFQVNFGTLGLNLPYILGQIISRYSNTTMLLLGFILYIAIFLYLYAISTKSKSDFPNTSSMRNLTLLGFVIFFLGYAIFFTSNKVGFSPTGIDNRVAIAAAIGIAFTIVGGAGWISTLILPDKFAKWFFCVLIAIICTGGFLIINTIASFWVTAYQQGLGVLAEIHQQFPVMPKGSTLILDGICPYTGPGIVFESQWDLKGALQTIYHDSTLRADIVTPRLEVKNDGINTQIYTFTASYPFKKLFIYNFRNKVTYPIPDAQVAHAYFQKFNPDNNNGCPAGNAGNGVSIF